MSTVVITKEKAEFIKKTATKEINPGKNFERTIELTAGKLLAENCDPKTIDVKTALLKTSNCVGFHLLENVIKNNFEQVRERMVELNTVKL